MERERQPATAVSRCSTGTGRRRLTVALTSVPIVGNLQRTRRHQAIASCVVHADRQRTLAGCGGRRWRQSASGQTNMLPLRQTTATVTYTSG